MTTTSIVKHTDMNKDIFFEGNLVTTEDDQVLLVTCIAKGYDDNSEGTFWGIDLSSQHSFISGGNYMKSLFKQFVGTVTLEGKF